jgi:hypothetical protein
MPCTVLEIRYSLADFLMRFRFVSLVLAAGLLALSSQLASASEPSLYEKSKSRTLTPEEQKSFGPQSGGRHYDERMIRAAHIAQERAQPKMTWYCWRYVKNALMAAGVIDSRPNSPYAKEAGEELCRKYGFVRLPIKDPMKAPVGAVVVYGGADAGHVEIRTEKGFVSDFFSKTPYPRPLVGVFVKPS